MTPKVVSRRDALFAAAALREVAARLDERGKVELAESARRVADGLVSGGVITADGTA